MIPRAVLVDGSLIHALVTDVGMAPDRRSAAAETFADLLERYERHERRLLARSDHLRSIDKVVRRSLFGPVDALHVARQHRRLAESVRLDGADGADGVDGVDGASVDLDQRITLVLLRQERIAEVAACGEPALSYARLGLTVFGATA